MLNGASIVPENRRLGHLRATRQAVREIQRTGNHDARIAIHPQRRSGILEGDADAQFEGRQATLTRRGRCTPE